MAAAPLTVLVLGMGGTVNQAIVRALRESTLRVRVLGACISPLSAGLYLCDRALLSPRAEDPRFLPWLTSVCDAEGVRIVLTGVDAILVRLADHASELRRRTAAVAVVSTTEALATAGDKLATCRWLAAQGLPAPRCVVAGDAAGVEELLRLVGFPLFAKPRQGRGSRGALPVENRDDLAYAVSRPDFVLQEYLGDPREEYTAGCFCSAPGEVLGTIVMRRELEAGSTVRAIAGDHPDVAAAAARIASALGAVGPCNVQLRRRGGELVCFEVNLRFSSTTGMRARLGFNEVEAAVRWFALGEPVASLLRPRPGIALRYWQELYVRPEAAAELATCAALDEPTRTALVGVGSARDVI